MNEPLEIILALQYIVNIHCLALRFFPYILRAMFYLSPSAGLLHAGRWQNPKIGVAHCPLEDRK